MILEWSWWAAPGLLAAALISLVAIGVFRASPEDALNRRLAMYLAVTAVYFVGFFALRFLFTRPEHAYAAAALLYPAALAIPLLTAMLLRPIPASGPDLVPKALVVGLAAYTVVVEVLWFVRPELFIQGLTQFADGSWSIHEGAFGVWLVNGMNVAALALPLWLCRPGAPRRSAVARRRSRAVFVSFAAYAVPFGVFGLALLWWPGVSWFEDSRAGRVANVLVPAAAQTALAVMLAVGILRTQLFDFAASARRGLTGGGVTVILAVLFVVVSETLEAIIDPGNFALTLIAAGTIAMLLRPVQRLIQRAADRMVPTAAVTEDARMAVYRDAVETALRDGRVEVRERRLLRALQERLQITAERAGQIEAELTAETQGG